MNGIDLALPVLTAMAGTFAWKHVVNGTTSWTSLSVSVSDSFRLSGEALPPDRRDNTVNIFQRKRTQPPMEPAPGTPTVKAPTGFPPPIPRGMEVPGMKIDYSSLAGDPGPTQRAQVQAAPEPEPTPEEPPQGKPQQAVALDELSAVIDAAGSDVVDLIAALQQAHKYVEKVAQEKALVEKELAAQRERAANDRADWEVQRAAWEEERQTVDASIKELAKRVNRLKNTATPPGREQRQ